MWQVTYTWIVLCTITYTSNQRLLILHIEHLVLGSQRLTAVSLAHRTQTAVGLFSSFCNFSSPTTGFHLFYQHYVTGIFAVIYCKLVSFLLLFFTTRILDTKSLNKFLATLTEELLSFLILLLEKKKKVWLYWVRNMLSYLICDRQIHYIFKEIMSNHGFNNYKFRVN